VHYTDGIGLLYAGGLLADPGHGQIVGGVELSESSEDPADVVQPVVKFDEGRFARVVVASAGGDQAGIAASTGSPNAVTLALAASPSRSGKDLGAAPDQP